MSREAERFHPHRDQISDCSPAFLHADCRNASYTLVDRLHPLPTKRDKHARTTIAYRGPLNRFGAITLRVTPGALLRTPREILELFEFNPLTSQTK